MVYMHVHLAMVHNSTQFIPLTHTSWSKPTPHSITLTSTGAASIKSVASVTGVGGHSTIAQCCIRVEDHSVGGGSEGHADHCEKVIGYSDYCAPTTIANHYHSIT